MEAKSFLALCLDLPQLVIPASDGTRTLEKFDCKGLHISEYFRTAQFNDPGPKADEAVALLYALEHDATVADAYQSFGVPLDAIAYTPQQLGEFVVHNRMSLQKIGRSVFFLLKRMDKEGMKVIGGIIIPHKSGYLPVRAYHLDSVYVVRAKDGYLFMAP